MIRECQVCHKYFPLKLSAVVKGRGKYCSRECSFLACRFPVPVCKNCGKEFKYRKNAIYCSKECLSEMTRKNNIVKCPICKEEYIPYWSGVGKKTGYCSAECANASRNKSGINYKDYPTAWLARSQSLCDGYIKQRLKESGIIVTPGMIEVKRQQIMMKRQVYQLREMVSAGA